MNLRDLKQTLSAEAIQLTKSLGQNFLHDGNQLRRIVAAAELPGDLAVLEIGPGLGALTQALLEKAPRVRAIEKDRRLYELLRKRFVSDPRLELVHADALEHLRKEAVNWSEWSMVSNLPYSVASPILVEIARLPRPPKQIVVTLQLEVAERIAASPGSRDYGILTLLVQSRYQPNGYFRIPPECFFPVPEVISACLTLTRLPTLEMDQVRRRRFERIVKRAFSQRRKMMLKLLRCDWPIDQLEALFAQLGIDPKARAETVRLDQFQQLAERLTVP